MPDERLPVDSPAFWSERLARALASGEPWKALWDTDELTWESVIASHTYLLRRMFGEAAGLRILDCGCGAGDLLRCLRPGVDYTGVDLSPDLVSVARQRWPGRRFLVGDLRRLPFADRGFDVAVCRAVEGMVIANQGIAAWHEMEAEILRVADRLVILSYVEPDVGVTTDSRPSPAEFAENRITLPGGYLVYRPGKAGTCEIYDLFVQESHRRQGVGRRLLQRLEREPFDSLHGFTRETNAGALDFYRAMGFRLVLAPGFYRGMDGVLFTKRLARDRRPEDRLV